MGQKLAAVAAFVTGVAAGVAGTTRWLRRQGSSATATPPGGRAYTITPDTEKKVDIRPLLQLLEDGWPLDSRAFILADDDGCCVMVHTRHGIAKQQFLPDGSHRLASYNSRTGGVLRFGDGLPETVRTPGLTYQAFLLLAEEHGLDRPVDTPA